MSTHDSEKRLRDAILSSNTVAVVHAIVNCGVSPSAAGGYYCLRKSIELNNAEVTHALLQVSRFDFDACVFALHCALTRHLPDIVDVVCRANRQVVCAADNFAVRLAARNNDVRSAQHLLDAGASVYANDCEAIVCAIVRRNVRMLELFFRYTDFNAENVRALLWRYRTDERLQHVVTHGAIKH